LKGLKEKKTNTWTSVKKRKSFSMKRKIVQDSSLIFDIYFWDWAEFITSTFFSETDEICSEKQKHFDQ